MLVIDAEPDGCLGRMGPLHPVLKVRRDVDVIPRPQMDAFLYPGIRCDEDQDGLSLHQQYPFVFILIEPLSGRGLLPLGEDALDTNIVGTDQIREHFIPIRLKM